MSDIHLSGTATLDGSYLHHEKTMEDLWKNHCPICVELQLNSEFLNDSSWCDRLHQVTGMALKSPIMATFPGHDRPTVPRADLSVLASSRL